MSVLVEFAMFPLDKGESVSVYVSKIIDMLKQKDVRYKLTPMGTIYETETFREATDILNLAYDVLEKESNRVYATAKFDIKKGRENAMDYKIKSVVEKLNQN